MFTREHLTRKIDLVSNVTDVFDRQQVSSDPGVRLYDKLVGEGDLHIGEEGNITISAPLQSL